MDKDKLIKYINKKLNSDTEFSQYLYKELNIIAHDNNISFNEAIEYYANKQIEDVAITKTAVNNRRSIIKEIAKESILDINQIANLLYSTQAIVKSDLDYNMISNLPQTGNNEIYEYLCEQRDITLNTLRKNGQLTKEALAQMGFLEDPNPPVLQMPQLPIFRCKEEALLFAGKSLKEIAMEQSVSISLCKKHLENAGISTDVKTLKDIVNQGYRYRLELKLYDAALNIINRTNTQFDTKDIVKKEESIFYNLIDISKENLIKELLVRGFSGNDIQELTEVSNYIQRNKLKIFKQILKPDTPFDYKYETRRNHVYELYEKYQFSQEEVALALGITRGTVYSDLNKYYNEHPEIERSVNNSSISKFGRLEHVSRYLTGNSDHIVEDVKHLHNIGIPVDKLSLLLGLQEDNINNILKFDTTANKSYVKDLCKDAYINASLLENNISVSNINKFTEKTKTSTSKIIHSYEKIDKPICKLSPTSKRRSTIFKAICANKSTVSPKDFDLSQTQIELIAKAVGYPSSIVYGDVVYLRDEIAKLPLSKETENERQNIQAISR